MQIGYQKPVEEMAREHTSDHSRDRRKFLKLQRSIQRQIAMDAPTQNFRTKVLRLQRFIKRSQANYPNLSEMLPQTSTQTEFYGSPDTEHDLPITAEAVRIMSALTKERVKNIRERKSEDTDLRIERCDSLMETLETIYPLMTTHSRGAESETPEGEIDDADWMNRCEELIEELDTAYPASTI